MKHDVPYLLCVKKPLEPLAGPEKVRAKIGAPMPDLFPLSPLIHSPALTHYDITDGFGTEKIKF